MIPNNKEERLELAIPWIDHIAEVLGGDTGVFHLQPGLATDRVPLSIVLNMKKVDPELVERMKAYKFSEEELENFQELIDNYADFEKDKQFAIIRTILYLLIGKDITVVESEITNIGEMELEYYFALVYVNTDTWAEVLREEE